ncbi:MAG: MbnP family protein [Candidatus Krumholzibacteriia bacterium]
MGLVCRRPRRTASLVLCSLACVAAGCGDDEPTAPAGPQPGTVNLQMMHQVDGAALAFDQILYTNAAGDEFSVVRLDYLISNLVLHGTGGSTHEVSGPFFSSARDAPTLRHTLAAVPAGDYDRVSFTFGLAETLNATNAFVDEDWNSRMTWPSVLGGGYHYMIMDGFVRNPSGGDDLTYNTHLGRTGTDPHSFAVTLPVDRFTVDGNESDIRIVMEIQEWYVNPNVYAFPEQPFIMDKPDIQETLRANGSTVFSAEVAP